ncbi:FHA domain-containing protein [Cohnella endophytica]|uniref:FHA domain-containing protein n=1 Tax=Cohnella endophytica TaxID=2419778 RepID=A0A494XRI2_9BACL|nr:FHA domain-containing protein [Cohnella endophytica]RKP50123.1 FHA domain-containing protein [Cohnella endophytica]
MSERTEVKRERRERHGARRSIGFRKARKLIVSVSAYIGLAALPLPVSASARPIQSASSRMEAGALPLFAALGIGIFVAVVAVIAFLQMTGKDKELRGPYTIKDTEPESEADSYGAGAHVEAEEHALSEEWNDGESVPDDAYEEHALTDYTIPVTRILSYPGHAEPAVDHEPRLRGLEGEHAGNSYRIANHRLTFGRDPAHCSVLFPYEAGEISRVHCTLKYDEESGLFILEDNGSSNGTFLGNGERLQPGVRRELRAGERFSLSGKEQLFEVLD